MKEKWKDIRGFEGFYKISNKGRVKSFHGKKPIIRKLNNSIGYRVLYLTKKPSIRELWSVHRLVAIHFIANPENKPEVNHIDGVRSNNNVNNLEWCTSSENCTHAYEIGLRERGENFYASKLTENQAIDIINAYKLGCFSQKELAEAYNISKSSIKDLLAGRNWAHLDIQDEIRVRTDRVVQYN